MANIFKMGEIIVTIHFAFKKSKLNANNSKKFLNFIS